jgi:uncharacterized phage protein gp47/JayE
VGDFVNLDLPSDPEQLREQMFDTIRSRWPDWEPADGNLETWMVDAFARLGSEVIDLVQRAGEEIFKEFGTDIMQLPPETELHATGQSTWTMIDNAGYTIFAGTEVGIPASGNDLVAFEVVSDVTVPPGSTVTGTGEVSLRAVIGGTDANELDATPVLISAFDYVDTIVLEDPTSGGQDEEDPADYIERLRDELELLTPTPILPEEFAVLALRVPGVYRAVCVDGWNPTAPSTGNDRYAGLVCLDENGDDVDAGVKTAVEEYLDALREVNFVVDVGAPTVTAIDVTTTVRCYETFEPADVDAAVTAALEEFFSPLRWGTPSVGSPDTDWVNTDEVRFLEVAACINNVAGVNYIESLTVEGAGVDVALSGVVPLTNAGTIAVTANAGP